ncbi:MAG: nuclear transport factor 2 family protein [Opitutaceae bacterium]|nr:nuclear transport factor 2 family protein [Opitutaceae bacterium]
MKTTRCLFVFLLSLLATSALYAALPPVIAAAQADQARVKAMMAGDATALANLMSDQLRFAHSDGRVESKADYVKNLLAGDTAYADVKLSELETKQIAPDVVYVLGAQQMRKRLGPDWSEVKLRYLAVWRNEGGTWRLVAWQSARPAGNSVVPPKK